jgi:flagellar hook assembly protein FlgD
MYRPDTMGLVFTSKFLSINSPTVFNTPVIGIADRSSSAQSYAIDIYPNPFTEKIEISLNIGYRAKNIELKIYDVSGKLIKQFRDISDQKITWSGIDDSGKKVPAGIYFIEVTDGGVQLTRKVVLQR